MTTDIEVYETDNEGNLAEAILGNRRETTNYVCFTGGGEFQSKRGGPRITVYLTHDEDAELDSPAEIRCILARVD